MRTYTVHARTEEPLDEAPDRRFVKEGFCWPALFFPLLWLLFHRMWLVLLAWLAVTVIFSVVGNVWPGTEDALGVIAILFAFWFAWEANGLRRWSLGRKGWPMVDVVNGRGRWEAELAHFRRLQFSATTPYAAAPRSGSPARPAPRGEPVVGGLFPEARR